MELTNVERALVGIVHNLRHALVSIMVDGDPQSRVIARTADREAVEAWRELPAYIRRAEGERRVGR